MAPPLPVAELPDSVEFVNEIFNEPEIAPPFAAVLLAKRVLVAVKVEFRLTTPPELLAVLLENVQSLAV
jgi:hypothetical protein